MICTLADLRVSLGMTGTLSDAVSARLQQALFAGHTSVKAHLKYEPEQKVWADQYYPRVESNYNGSVEGVWDVDPSHSRASVELISGAAKVLQLEHLPVRAITEIKVDPSARFGQGSGDFGDGTVWTEGVDYFVDRESQYLSMSGQLLAVGSWPVEPGTVKVSYRAGFSQLEFEGQAATTATDDDGFITVAGVDASGIKQAVLLECMRAYHTFKAFSLQSTGVHAVGPFSSERLGDYSYSLASGQAAAILTTMGLAISPQAQLYLEPFAHYGLMLL